MAGTQGRSGGRRQGKAGRQYPNRSDMRKGPNQSPQATSNQTYGDRGQQLASQKQMPLSRQAAPVSASSPGMAAPASAGGGGSPVIPSLTAPSTRPGEPITAGLSGGPGPGPEALNAQVDPLVKAAAVLNQLGDRVDPGTKKIRDMVNAHLGNQGAA